MLTAQYEGTQRNTIPNANSSTTAHVVWHWFRLSTSLFRVLFLFYLEYRGSKLFWNLTKILPDHMASGTRWHSS